MIPWQAAQIYLPLSIVFVWSIADHTDKSFEISQKDGSQRLQMMVDETAEKGNVGTRADTFICTMEGKEQANWCHLLP